MLNQEKFIDFKIVQQSPSSYYISIINKFRAVLSVRKNNTKETNDFRQDFKMHIWKKWINTLIYP